MIGDLRILSIGAGAIGTYIGGSLALCGYPVVFLERPEVAAALRDTGMLLGLPGGERHLTGISVVDSLPEAFAEAAFDVMLFALKSFDTAAALEKLAPYSDQLPPMLCVQNGVDNELRIAAVIGEDRVIGGTVTSAIGRRGTGNIVVERLRGVGIETGHKISSRLLEALDLAGLRPQGYPRRGDMKWSKLLTNLVANATAAILDMTPAEIFSHPGLYRLEMEQLREALRVMRAQGLEVVDLPGTPVRLLALGTRLPAAAARPLMVRAIGSGRGGKMPSLHIDLHGSRGQSEVEDLNGAVARYGQRVGVDTPVNRMLAEILMKLTRGEISLDTYARRPDRLLETFAGKGR